MKSLRKILLASLGVLPFIAPMDVSAVEPTEEILSSASEMPWRSARLMVEAQSGSRSIGTLDAMVPFMGDNDFMVYANLMAKYGTGANNANGNTFEGNFGLGFRRVNDAEDSIWGAYAFYDSLRSVNNNQFTQVTLGVERLGLTWDFRANAYLPLGTTKYVNDDYKGGTIEVQDHDLIEYIKTVKESANAGGDIEIGRTLGSDRLRGYFAVYSFGSHLTGPRARLEYKLNDTIGLNATVQHDQTRGTQFLLGARFSMGGVKTTGAKTIFQRMTDPVVRDIDIVLDKDVQDKTVLEQNKYFEVNNDASAGGNGTKENPFNNIEEAVQQADAGAYIIVRGTGSTDYDLSGQQVQLKPGQTISSSSADVYHRGMKLVDSDGLDTRPNFINGGFVMADDSSIQHFDFNGNNADPLAVLLNDAQRVSLYDVTINNYLTGLQMLGDSSVNLANVKFNNNDIGMDVAGNIMVDGSIDITNSTSTALKIRGGVVDINAKVNLSEGLQGINIDNGAVANFNADVNTENFTEFGGRVQNNSYALFKNYMSTKNGTGLQVTNSSINVLAGLFSENTGVGILLDGAADGISIERYQQMFTDITVQNNAGGGIQHAVGYAMFIDATIQGNEKFGVNLKSDSITLLNSNLIDNKNYGLWVNGDVAFTRSARLYNVNIENTQTSQSEAELVTEQTLGHGVYLQNAGDVLLTDVIISGSSGSGIWVKDGTLKAHDIVVKENSGYTDPGDGNIFQPDAGEIEKIRDHGLSYLNAGVRVDGGEVQISGADSKIIDNALDGLWVNGGTVTAHDLYIANNESGVMMTNGSLELNSSMIFKNREFGVFLRNVDYDNRTGSVVLKMNDSSILETINQDPDALHGRGLGHGLAVEHHQSTIDLYNTNIMNNGGNGIFARSGDFTISASELGKSQISFNGGSGFYSGLSRVSAKSVSFNKIEMQGNQEYGVYGFGSSEDRYSEKNSVFSNPKGNRIIQGTIEYGFEDDAIG